MRATKKPANKFPTNPILTVDSRWVSSNFGSFDQMQLIEFFLFLMKKNVSALKPASNLTLFKVKADNFDTDFFIKFTQKNDVSLYYLPEQEANKLFKIIITALLNNIYLYVKQTASDLSLSLAANIQSMLAIIVMAITLTANTLAAKMLFQPIEKAKNLLETSKESVKELEEKTRVRLQDRFFSIFSIKMMPRILLEPAATNNEQIQPPAVKQL